MEQKKPALQSIAWIIFWKSFDHNLTHYLPPIHTLIGDVPILSTVFVVCVSHDTLLCLFVCLYIYWLAYLFVCFVSFFNVLVLGYGKVLLGFSVILCHIKLTHYFYYSKHCSTYIDIYNGNLMIFATFLKQWYQCTLHELTVLQNWQWQIEANHTYIWKGI